MGNHRYLLAFTNPGQPTSAEIEISKLEAILTQIKNALIVVSPDNRVILVNDTARAAR